ncbi:hypothetical protein ScPMuIL_006856 [Solemya velum]
METTVGIFLVILGLSQYVASSSEWGYIGDAGPSHWTASYENCGKNSQSPIDIPVNSMLEVDEQLGKFSYHGYDNTSVKMTLHNNGHTAVVLLDGDIWIENGGLPSKYHAVQFHFHWGGDNDKGSEHTIEGRKYPLELHIVHYKTDYGSFANAKNKSDGLAVIGVLATEMTNDNENLNKLVDNLHHVKYAGSEGFVLSGLSLKHLLPTYTDRFYRYSGSLTTPTCDESVTWTVLTERMLISPRQLAKFRELFTTAQDAAHEEKMVDNFRPVMNLNSRKVKINHAIAAGFSIHNNVSIGIVAAFVLILSQL